MAVTITINGLTLCHQGSGGTIHNTLPDVCKTPDKGVPVPYQNEAYSKDLINGTTSCFADGGHMIANLGSKFAVSVFDEPGAMGGVVSGTNKAEAEWISHSFDVFFEGKPACRLTDKMFMNHRNTASLAGLVQPHLSGYTGRDLIIEALCEVFCTVRREGMDAKAEKSPDKRFNYSKRAEELRAQHPGLKKLSSEKRFLHAVDNKKADVIKVLKDSSRKVVPFKAIKSRLVTEAMKNAGAQVINRLKKKALLKFIPVVNVLSTAWDTYDMLSTGYKALKEVGARLPVYDPAKATTFRAQPDLVNVDPATGKPTKIYDYKFDRPAMTDGNGNKLGKYQDKWQKGQEELYNDMVGKDNVKEIDNERCDCKSK